MSARSEIDALANFIMAEVPGEPSQSQGAGHTAIRIIRTQQTRIEELEEDDRQDIAVTRMIMEERCPSDEHHCTCVPILRAHIEALEREKVRWSDLARLAYEYVLRSAPTLGRATWLGAFSAALGAEEERYIPVDEGDK